MAVMQVVAWAPFSLSLYPASLTPSRRALALLYIISRSVLVGLLWPAQHLLLWFCFAFASLVCIALHRFLPVVVCLDCLCVVTQCTLCQAVGAVWRTHA